MRHFCSAKVPYNFLAKNITAVVFVSTVRRNKSLPKDFVKLMMLWTTGLWLPLNVLSPLTESMTVYNTLALYLYAVNGWMMPFLIFFTKYSIRYRAHSMLVCGEECVCGGGGGGGGKHDLLSFWSWSINLPVVLEFSLHFALVLINLVMWKLTQNMFY